MSTWAIHTVRCARCDHTFETQLADGLHITRLPKVRQRILEGTFHHLVCPGCGQQGLLHRRMLYTDFARHHWVAVAEPWTIGRWEQWLDVLHDEFDHNLRRAAPPMVQALADRFTVRLVFGLDGLAEKLRAWDAGLDDGLIEVLKLQLMGSGRPFLAPGVRLRLAEVDEEGQTLTFDALRPAERAHDRLIVAMDAYRRLQTDRLRWVLAEPALFESAFRSIERRMTTSLSAHAMAHRPFVLVAPLRPQDDSPLFATEDVATALDDAERVER